MQIMELSQPGHSVGQGQERSMHPYFIGAQYHPELTGRPLVPQPMFMGLVAASILRKYGVDAEVRRRLLSAPEMQRWCRPTVGDLQKA
jgi:hypothetical protein